MSSIQYGLWDGTCGPISGSTNFGFYDNEIEFQDAGPKIANFCARKLGYPIVDVELKSGSFFTCFEEAISEYSSQVNQFNIKDNLLAAKGSPTSSNLTHTNVANNLGPLVRIAESYGTEAGLYSNVDYKTGSITVQTGVQDYNIQSLYSDVSESGESIVLQQIHHYAPPALVRFFDPYAGTGMGTYSTMTEFGFDNMSPATSFLMMPVFEDLLRLQAIEFNDTVRRSGYSFKILGDTLKIFPIPKQSFQLWFEYFVQKDRDDIGNVYPANTVSDFSNITYNNMKYANINDVGKQWIRSYTLAIVKELLGHIRSKYGSIPIPDGEVTLDGSDLISNAQEMKTQLMEQLREILEQTSNKALMEAKAEEAENQSNIMKHVPTKIYIA